MERLGARDSMATARSVAADYKRKHPDRKTTIKKEKAPKFYSDMGHKYLYAIYDVGAKKVVKSKSRKTTKKKTGWFW